MLHCRYANVTYRMLHKPKEHILENMKNEPNNTDTPCAQQISQDMGANLTLAWNRIGRRFKPPGPLHTRAKSRDHEIVRAQKKVSKGRPKTPHYKEMGPDMTDS